MILLSSSTTMLIIALCAIVPFGLFIWVDKRSKSKKKKIFKDFAKQQGVSLSVAEFWNNSCMGHDSTSNILMFMNSRDSEIKYQKIQLDDVKKCAITMSNKTHKSGGREYSELEQLDLNITFHSKTTPERITLFTVAEPFSPNQELPRAEKWQAFINEHKKK